MVSNYLNYNVEIKNVKFISDDGRTCPRTAIITFLNERGEEIGNELFGAVDMQVVYENIKEGKELNLDNFYIPEFSLAAFRRHNNLDKKDPVTFTGFSAKNAFFEAKTVTDFSHSKFPDGDISFEGTHFAKGKVTFTGSVFGKGNVNFSHTFFGDGNIA